MASTENSKRSGFTIIELLVVIVIIGILAVIVIISYSTMTQRAAAAVLQSDLSKAFKQLEIEKNDSGSYPLTESSVNMGKGLNKSPDTTYNQYFSTSIDYCLSAMSLKNTSIKYHISSSNGIPTVGVCVDNWKQISPSYDYTCAISFDDKAYCWGDNSYGQLGNGTTTDSSLPILVSQGAMPSGPVKSITASDSHACAIASDDRAYCWGYNDSDGELGDGTNLGSNLPVQVARGAMTNTSVKAITSKGWHTCVISMDDKVYCWGYGGDGQLGDGSITSSNVPVLVSQGAMPSESVKSISANFYHTCAIAMNDKAYCWGYNYDGELGNGSTTSSNVPVLVSQGAMPSESVKSISAGTWSTCAIAANDKAYCWGYNGQGQLGNGTEVSSSVPTQVSQGVMPSDLAKSISIYRYHTCAIAMDDKAYCWGYNDVGQFGDDSLVWNSSIPVAVNASGILSGKLIKSLEVGRSHSCAIDFDGRVYCWGLNSNGQLGIGTISGGKNNIAVVGMKLDSVNPVNSNNGILVKIIDSGNWHTCAVTFDNKIYCWGSNEYGQLGNNSMVDSSRPVAVDMSGVLNGKAIKSISAGHTNTCVTTSDDLAYCWGSNSSGQFGNNTISPRSLVPVAAATAGALAGKHIKSIAAGNWHICAIASDDQAYCWGGGVHGNLGNNASVNSPAPVAVDTSGVLSGKTILSIKSGGWHTCVLASDNKVYCWGYNGYGQIGDNTSSDRAVPTTVNTSGVLNGKDIAGVFTGRDHSCAVDIIGKAYCWGRNDSGNLGNDVYTNSRVPVDFGATGDLSGKMVSSISGGFGHTCALDSDNRVYCTGDNGYGQLGDGYFHGEAIPGLIKNGIMPGVGVKSISSGAYHVCAIASDDRLYCWGVNSAGTSAGILGDNLSSGLVSSLPVLTFSPN